MTTNFTTPSFWDRRPGESETGFNRRVGQFAHHREDAQADVEQAHAEFRAAQEARTQGTGIGLAGDATPQQRAAALGSRGFGSGREIAKEGHLAGQVAVPGSIAVPRVYVGDVRDQGDGPGVSPLAAYFRNQQ